MMKIGVLNLTIVFSIFAFPIFSFGQSMQTSDSEYEVFLKNSYKDLTDMSPDKEFYFLIKKNNGSEKTVNVGEYTYIDQIVLNGKYLSVIGFNVGADNSEAWYDLIDCENAINSNDLFAPEGMDQYSFSPDKRFLIFTPYIWGRVRETGFDFVASSDTVNPYVSDLNFVLEFEKDKVSSGFIDVKKDVPSINTEKVPKTADDIHDCQKRENWLVKSNYIWSGPKVYFLVREKFPRKNENEQILKLVEIDLRNGLEKAVFKLIPFSFSNDSVAADLFLNNFQNLKISWKKQGDVIAGSFIEDLNVKGHGFEIKI